MSTPAAWWESYFSGLWLDIPRQAKPEEQTRAEADFIEKALHLTAEAAVLDVPCGEGRLSLELGSRGHWVHGYR
jgi:cyclopropane fatty-acyl-phospholipid synthase-like methyltransferase